MSDDWKSMLSKQLRERRAALGLSLEKLADASGIGKTTLADIEGGRIGETGPGIGTILKLAAVLQTTPDVLCGIAEQPREALLDTVAVDLITRATSIEDLDAIQQPAGWRYGILLGHPYRWVSRSEFEDAERRCNARIARLAWEGNSKQRRRGK